MNLQGISWFRLRLARGFENDRETEVLEAADISAGGALGVAEVEIVLAELPVRGVAGEHMVDANEQLVGDRQGSAPTTSAALEFVIFGLEEAATLARGGVAQRGLQVGVAPRLR